MNKVIVTSDSTSDLTENIIDDLDIRIIPLYINVGDSTYKDGVDIIPEDIFKSFEESGTLAKTSAIPIYDFEVFFKSLIDQGYSIIHFSISSLFSSSHEHAVAAKNLLETDQITCIDSLNLSTGNGHLVMRAAELAKEGFTREEIVKEIEGLIPKVNSSFILDDLTYLWKGGRCSGVSALGANIIKIKPCIEVTDGTMKVGKKYRGSLNRTVKAYIDDRLEDIDSIDSKRIFITNTTHDTELIEIVKEKIESKNYFNEVIVTKTSGTIACHCGPGTLGVLYMNK